MLICAREGCDNKFVKRSHNNKYCSTECCKIETNARIMKRYYEAKDQKAGKERICRTCKITKLSRYNNSWTCGSCETKKTEESRRQILDLVISLSA